MATEHVCRFNKFGYCRYRDTCRNLHVNETCENTSCDISRCNQRHPRECRYYREFSRCKFDPCKFKHIIHTSQGLEIKKLVTDIEKCSYQLKIFEDQIQEMERKLLIKKKKLRT